MLKNIFKKNRLDDPEQLSKATYYVVNACSHFMMWRKQFSPDQIHYLLYFVGRYFPFQTPNDAAHFVTKQMANLHETTSVMGFLQNSGFLAKLDKPYKRFAVQEIIVYLLLAGDDQSNQLNYVSYIHEDTGLGGAFAYQRLVDTSYSQYEKVKGVEPDNILSEAIGIIDEALSRTDYVNNGM